MLAVLRLLACFEQPPRSVPSRTTRPVWLNPADEARLLKTTTLKRGETIEEVKAALGQPDYDQVHTAKESDRFISRNLTYLIHGTTE